MMTITMLVTISWLFNIPLYTCAVMLDCALGLVSEAKCPLDGGWTLWSHWGACEGECGAVGRQVRTRNCSNPRPARNGVDCSGDQREVKQCAVPGCTYEQYATLLARDSVRLLRLKGLLELGGVQSALLSKCLAAHCDYTTVAESLTDTNIAAKFWNALQCVKKNTGCPVAGGWGGWSEWSRCSARCGPGQQIRCRPCCDPPPTSPDLGCAGDSCTYQPCTGTDCTRGREDDGIWSEWSHWSSCNAPCNFGITRRSRVCQKGSQEEQKRKTISNYTGSAFSNNEYLTDYYSYYDDYINNNYGMADNMNNEEDTYKDSSEALWGVRKRRNKVCGKPEYYVSEDKDYSTSLLSSLKYTKTTGEEMDEDKDEDMFKTILPISQTTESQYSEKTYTEGAVDETIVKGSKEKGHEDNFKISPKPLDTNHEDEGDKNTLTTALNVIYSKSTKYATEPLLYSSRNELGSGSESYSITEKFISEESTENRKPNKKDHTVSKSSKREKTSTTAYKNTNYEDNKSGNEDSQEIIISLDESQETTNVFTDSDECGVELFEHKMEKLPACGKENKKESIRGKANKHKHICTTPRQKIPKPTSAQITEDEEDMITSRKKVSKTTCEPKTINENSECFSLKPEHTGDACDRHLSITMTTRLDKSRTYTTTPFSLSISSSFAPSSSALSTSSSYPTTSLSEMLSTTTPTGSSTTFTMEESSNYSSETTILPTTELSNLSLISTFNMSTSTENVSSRTMSEIQLTTYITANFSTKNFSDTFLSSSAPPEGTLENQLEIDSNSSNYSSEITILPTTELSNLSLISTFNMSTSTENVSSRTMSEIQLSTNITTNSSTKNFSDTFLSSSAPPEGSLENQLEMEDSEKSPRNEQICYNLKKSLQLPSFNDSFRESEDCKGPFEEIKPCNIQPCNERGGWSSWSAWSACVPECGLGRQVSTRSCTAPEPRTDAGICRGDTTWKQACYLQPCPVKVETSRAMLMSGSSTIKYERLGQHASILQLYLRFRPYNTTGTLITRTHADGDRISLSMYNSHVLLGIDIDNCKGHLLSGQQLTIGDWHEVLLSVVGAVVRLRVDDSVLTQWTELSCRPLSPDYDMHMTVGGNFVGEVDRLTVNFRNYGMQKQHLKRDTWVDRDAVVMPSESSQVQFKLNNEEMQSVSLAHFLYTPCFANDTFWKLELAIKPQIDDGLVLFLRGYNKNEFLFVTLEQTRIRLRIKYSAVSGECEQSITVSPQTWLHITLSKQVTGPIGLSVNGGIKCFVSLAKANDTEEPTIHCSGGVYLGEVPLSVKEVLASDNQHSEPLHSPLGLLGSMSVDNQSLDLTKLQRKMSPDLIQKHPSSKYLFSSYSASSTVYYKEMIVLQGEPLSLLCVYDLSNKEEARDNVYSRDHDLDTANYSASWLKLDRPVESAFLNSSGVNYQIVDNGRSTTLKISSYSAKEHVEGFYSCWLHYPLPLQPGINIITYGVLVISTDEDIQTRLNYMNFYHMIFTVFTFVLFIVWLIAEGVIDFRKGSGFYRCRKLSIEEVHKIVERLIFSDQLMCLSEGVHMLGGLDNANLALNRYENYLEAQAQAAEEAERQETDLEDKSFSPTTDEEEITSVNDIEMSIPEIQTPKSLQRKIVATVNTNNRSPFAKRLSPNHTSITKGKILNKDLMAMDNLKASDTENVEYHSAAPRERAGGKHDNLIDVSEKWRQKEIGEEKTTMECTPIGLIQNTSAYRSIKSELKFKPDKFKELEKYEFVKSEINKES